jgi:hypothetical protein
MRRTDKRIFIDSCVNFGIRTTEFLLLFRAEAFLVRDALAFPIERDT